MDYELLPRLKLAAVKLAIEHNQKKFIAHPITQRYAINEWYRGVEWLTLRSYHAFFLFALLATLLYPLSSLLYLWPFGSHRFRKIMAAPYVKYIHKIISYIIFLLIVFTLLLDPSQSTFWGIACSPSHSLKPTTLKLLIVLWIIGFLAAHIREIVYYKNILAHFKDMANIVELASLSCYIIAFFLELGVALLIEKNAGYQVSFLYFYRFITSFLS